MKPPGAMHDQIATEDSAQGFTKETCLLDSLTDLLEHVSSDGTFADSGVVQDAAEARTQGFVLLVLYAEIEMSTWARYA